MHILSNHTYMKIKNGTVGGKAQQVNSLGKKKLQQHIFTQNNSLSTNFNHPFKKLD